MKSSKPFHCGKSSLWNRTPHRRWPSRAPDRAFQGHRIEPLSIRLGFPGTLSGFAHGFSELRGALDAREQPLSASVRYNIELVFEEIVGNILRYASQGDAELHVEVSIDSGGGGIAITLSDDGMPFDPCTYSDASIPAGRSAEAVGGFGLRLVRHAARAMSYERSADERNRLTVILGR
jgi:anti-sigma regulatory factor (Ser/Thr protein kinase)